MSDGFAAFVFVLILTLAGIGLVGMPSCSVGGENGRKQATHAMQVEAVQQGHAHWVTNKTGETTFVWNEPCGEEVHDVD